MIQMDFTTTAMTRPEILETTLESFSKNLEDINLKDCRLVINIDPLPPGIKRKYVINVAEKYFKKVEYNLPTVANFTAAVNWIWKTANTEYIFHLEDDWELLEPVSMNTIIEYFRRNRKLLQVILRAYRYNYATCALSPSIIHKKMYSAIGGNLNPVINPEAQLRGKRFGIHMPIRERGKASPAGKIIVYPENRKGVILKDLGRSWINRTKYKKTGEGKKARFITWETRK